MYLMTDLGLINNITGDVSQISIFKYSWEYVRKLFVLFLTHEVLIRKFQNAFFWVSHSFTIFNKFS